MSSAQTWDVRARFVALNPPFQGRSFPIVLFPAVIGRGNECEVFLDAVSISRQHAVVEERDGRFHIRDLGSRNGIKLADRPVHEAVLNAGDVVTVGDIQLRFEPASAGEPAAAKPQAAADRILTGQEIVALAQSAPAADLAAGTGPVEGAPDSQPRVGLNLKMIAVVVAALVLSVGVGAFLLRYLGSASAVHRAQWPAVMVKVGEKKWIRITRAQYLKIGTDTWWTPTDLSSRAIREIVVGDSQESGNSSGGDSIAEVERYDPDENSGEILVTGKSAGETGVTITLDNGSVLAMRVIVRGRLDDPLDSLLYGRYSAPERIAMAQQFLDNGIRIETEKPYLALQEYQKAGAVLTPLPDRLKGDLFYLQIGPRLARAQKTVDDQWKALSGKISVAVASNDLASAIDLLQEAVKLIPDPNDPRHQKAEGKLRALIRLQLEERQ